MFNPYANHKGECKFNDKKVTWEYVATKSEGKYQCGGALRGGRLTLWIDNRVMLRKLRFGGTPDCFGLNVQEVSVNTYYSCYKSQPVFPERFKAQYADNDAAKVRALELIGKLDKVASFKARVSMDNDLRSPEEIKAELEARLRAAFEENYDYA